MSDQNPHPGDTHQSQSPVGCPTPPPSGLTLIGALFHVSRLAKGEGKTVKPTTVRKFTKVCTPESERSTRDIYNVWLFIYSVPITTHFKNNCK